MKPDRLEILLRGQSEVARKVFEVVPIGQAWSPTQIKAELERTGASTASLHVVRGCLRELCSSNLIGEPTREMYRRRAIRNRQPSPQESAPEMQQPSPVIEKAEQPITHRSAVDLLSGIAARIGDAAEQHFAQLKQIAADLEDCALTLDQQGEANADDLKKLELLRTLLVKPGH